MGKNLPTPEGQEAGAHMVRMAEPAIAEMEAHGFPDERCSTCAFRLGTLPNGCPGTVMDAMKCGMEGEPFYCHDRRRLGEKCHGWLAMRLALDGKTKAMPWPFTADMPKGGD